MTQGLLSGAPVRRIHLQHHTDQILRIFRDALPIRVVEGVGARADLRQDLRIGVTEKGRIPAKHHVGDDAETPNVAHVIVLARQNLRRDVVRSAGLCRQDLAFVELARQAKVDDLQQTLLDGILRQEEEVLRFQVAMADMVLVHVVDSLDHLLHERGRLHLREVPSLNDSVEQLASCAQLHDQVDDATIFEGLVQLDDVWMVHHLHEGNLLLEPLYVFHLLLGNRLDSSAGPSLLALSLGHRPVGALSELLLVDVVHVLNPLV
mmetsp:Transcript_104098/g.301150  ORF Transcript_104098/g.301150 Transcript_104098/m.301150 type:complete len:263 (+) Transcript_104098:234-1022(+)